MEVGGLDKGVGPHEGFLHAYDLERRQFGLKMIMLVLNFAPDLGQILRLATVAKYPNLWWLVKYRWIFAHKGTHSHNQFMTDGILLGSRYRSQILYPNVKHQGVPPLECPPR